MDMWGVGFDRIRGLFFGGSHSKDCSILGSILGSTHLRKRRIKPASIMDETSCSI